MEDDEYNEDYLQPKYGVEFRDLERLGPAQKGQAEVIIDSIHSGEKLANIYRKAAQQGFSMEDTVKTLVGLYYNTFGGDKGFLIPFSSISEGLQKIDRIQFKNPIALTIGVKILDSTLTLQASRIDALWLTQRALLQDENIQKADVIRYAKLWQKILIRNENK